MRSGADRRLRAQTEAAKAEPAKMERGARRRRGSASTAHAARQRQPPQRRPADAPKPPNINKGDTAFMYAATMMVVLMTIPGLALFYGGLVRSKNMLSVLMQVFVTFSLISMLWMIYGYSLAFTGGSPFIGGLRRCSCRA